MKYWIILVNKKDSIIIPNLYQNRQLNVYTVFAKMFFYLISILFINSRIIIVDWSLVDYIYTKNLEKWPMNWKNDQWFIFFTLLRLCSLWNFKTKGTKIYNYTLQKKKAVFWNVTLIVYYIRKHNFSISLHWVQHCYFVPSCFRQALHVLLSSSLGFVLMHLVHETVVHRYVLFICVHCWQ